MNNTKTHKEIMEMSLYALRKYANEMGYEGRSGGWIYNKVTGRPVCQGWETFRRKLAAWAPLKKKHQTSGN